MALVRAAEMWPAWQRWRYAIVEAFVTANLAFLALDIYLAHSIVQFKPWGTSIPLWFSMAATLALIVGKLWARTAPRADRMIGFAVGLVAVLVGVGGLLLHLESRFFRDVTLKSLVYSAPFIAPLAYAGLGLVLLMNRMVRVETEEWARWLLLLALAGWFGNLGLSLADHAQNGFFHATEWIPVVSAAFAVAFLAVATFFRADAGFCLLTLAVMGVQAVVGAAGFGLHLWASLHGAGTSTLNKIIYGAPIFAPLLFANLALLAALGLIDMIGKLQHEGEPRIADAA